MILAADCTFMPPGTQPAFLAYTTLVSFSD